MKVSIFIFILAMLATGPVVAEESGALSSGASMKAEPVYTLDYGNDRTAEYAIDKRVVDRLGLFDASGGGQSTRYNVELDLEHEDSEWSFQVTVTVDF